MDKDFDFKTIGKHTPYRVPEHFFEDSQRKIWERVDSQRTRKQSRLLKIVVTVTAIAAVISGWLFVPSFLPVDYPVSDTKALASDVSLTSADPLDGWIKNLSDEELEEFVNFSENDIFFY